jgi:hypothetical protein
VLAITNRTEEALEEMTPQQIIDACEAVWDANKSNCSGFVKAVATSLGVTTFGVGDNADAIVNKLPAATGWAALTDLATVEANAAAGWFIVAGLQSTGFNPPRNNGHVVVVVQGDDPNHPGFPMAYWGTLGAIGRKNFSIRYAFIPGVDLGNVQYFGTELA